MCDSTHTSNSIAISDSDIRQLFQDPDRISQAAVRIVFDLKQHEIQTYLALVNNPESTARELAEVLDRHPRYTASVLRDLLNIGLVKRIRHILDNGGNVYVYEPAPLPVTKQILHEELDRWVDTIRAEIDALGEPTTTED